MIDRKGITDRVTLNGMTLMNWKIFSLPMHYSYVKKAAMPSAQKINNKPGVFFKGAFELPATGDTFFDMSNYSKGMVYINGNNLGRYWNIGPQQRLYCPAEWLKKGSNEIIVFDLHQLEAAPVTGSPSME
jgi:beta-galactosidase GanA